MKFVRKSLAIFMGFALALILMEMTFVIGHHLRQSLLATKSQEVAQTPKQIGSQTPITITVIGESTTESVFNEAGLDISWPAQMGRKLNAYFEAQNINAHAEVRNLAQAATSSPFQFTKLVNDSEAHPPDLVFSMIGFNDSGRIWNAQRGFIYRHSYLYRWLYWLQTAWLCPSCTSSDLTHVYIRTPPPAGHAKEVQQFQQSAENFRAKIILPSNDAETQKKLLKDYQDFVTSFKAKTPEDLHDWINATAAAEIWSLYRNPNIKSNELSTKAFSYARSLLDSLKATLVTTDGETLQEYCNIKSALDENCLEDIRRAIEAGLPINYSLLQMAVQHGAENNPYFVKIFERLGYDLQLQPNSGHLYFRKIAEFVRDQGATWFSVQYPTGNREALKLFFHQSDKGGNPLSSKNFYTPPPNIEVPPLFKDVILVGNENFNDIVNENNRSEYFWDMFALRYGHRFGHTTAKGHELIADNAMKALLENWNVVAAAIERRKKAPTSLTGP